MAWIGSFFVLIFICVTLIAYRRYKKRQEAYVPIGGIQDLEEDD